MKKALSILIATLLITTIGAQGQTNEVLPRAYKYNIVLDNITPGTSLAVFADQEMIYHEVVNEQKICLEPIITAPNCMLVIEGTKEHHASLSIVADVSAGNNTIVLSDMQPYWPSGYLPDRTFVQTRQEQGYNVNITIKSRQFAGKNCYFYAADYLAQNGELHTNHEILLIWDDENMFWGIGHCVGIWHDHSKLGLAGYLTEGRCDLWVALTYDVQKDQLDPENDPLGTIEYFQKKSSADGITFYEDDNATIETFPLEGLPGKTFKVNQSKN